MSGITYSFKIHGYDFGDTLLEGVYFDCVAQEDVVLSVAVEKKAHSYYKRLNSKMWDGLAKDTAEEVWSEIWKASQENGWDPAEVINEDGTLEF